jgi:6-pyruvoyltetrahydropterin/6-carboxytetrahydropterin synthase
VSFYVSKEVEFDAGHRVPNHSSKCRNPHGHRYKVRATITGSLVTTPGASDEGMLADFGDLKTILTEKIHDVLDHGFIVYAQDDQMATMLGVMEDGKILMPEFWRYDFKTIVFPYIPTAENLAAWSWQQIVRDISNMGFELVQLDVWETPTSIASYTGPAED